MKAIVATDRLWNIGIRNKLLFKIDADMERFKELTTGKVVVMGRKTFDSIGKALPNRTNLVVTSQDLGERDDIVYGDFFRITEELQKYDEDDIFIIGGKSIYRYYLPDIDTFYHTLLDRGDISHDPSIVSIEDLALIGYDLKESKKMGMHYGHKYYFNTWSGHHKYKGIIKILAIQSFECVEIYYYMNENNEILIEENNKIVGSTKNYIKNIINSVYRNAFYRMDLECSVVDKNKTRAIIDFPYSDIYLKVRGVRPVPYSLTAVGFGNDEKEARGNLLSMINKIHNLR